MDHIIIIRATDPDGKLFESIKNMLDSAQTKIVDFASEDDCTLSFPGLTINIRSGEVFREGIPIYLTVGSFPFCATWRSGPIAFLPKNSYIRLSMGKIASAVIPSPALYAVCAESWKPTREIRFTSRQKSVWDINLRCPRNKEVGMDFVPTSCLALQIAILFLIIYNVIAK